MSGLTDESLILQVQQILHHIIIKNKPRGMKPRTYAKDLRKYIMFFNDLKEDILIRNKIPHHFKIGETLLKELKWVFSDEEALLIYDALCSTNDDYNVDLKKTENIETEEEDSCNMFCAENASEYNQQVPITNKELPMNLICDGEETKFKIPSTPENISNNCRIQQMQTETCTKTQNPLLEANTGDTFTGLAMNQLYAQDFQGYGINKGVNTANFDFEGKIAQNLNCTFINEDAINSEIEAHAKTNDGTLKDKTKYIQTAKQQETTDTNEIPQENQNISDHSPPTVMNIDSESKVLDFYPQDTNTALESQLGVLMLQHAESNFSDSLKWGSLKEITGKKVDDRTVFFKKFSHVANQFNCALNSKIFSKPLDSLDQFIVKTNLLTIKDETPTGPYYADPNSRKNVATTSNPDFQWASENEQKIVREKTLASLLRTIFKYLHEILNDFSKLHCTTFNLHVFLVEQVFHDVKQYFDERYSTNTDNYVMDDGFNACCEFIKTALNNIFATDDLCQFLQWEEQCFILGELCNSNVVCRKTLTFLLDRTVAVLEYLEEEAKNGKRSVIQDPATIEKLHVIFPMIQTLVKKYVSLRPSKMAKTESSKTEEELSMSQLWRSHASRDEKHYDLNNLQDSEEEAATHSYEDKWIQNVEKMINLTKNRFSFFSHSAQEIFRVLEEFRGGDKVRFSFSQSQ